MRENSLKSTITKSGCDVVIEWITMFYVLNFSLRYNNSEFVVVMRSNFEGNVTFDNGDNYYIDIKDSNLTNLLYNHYLIGINWNN